MNAANNAPIRGEGASTIPTVAEFLNLSDWSFNAKFEVGQHNDYHWVTLDYDVEFEKFIPFPEYPYRVLVTHYDGYGGAAYCYRSTPGWRSIDECALSDIVAMHPPSINYAADTALMFINAQLSDQDLSAALRLVEEPDLASSSFWLFLDQLQPYLFISHMETEFFASKNKDLLDRLHSDQALAEAEEQAKTHLNASRLAKWESVGPECGPEECAEPGCKRLRVERATRCYMHQLQAFGGVF
jgi:hypothetical protein